MTIMMIIFIIILVILLFVINNEMFDPNIGSIGLPYSYENEPEIKIGNVRYKLIFSTNPAPNLESAYYGMYRLVPIETQTNK
jgi:hypothetical protein